jgi:diphosphomevalonate decarboxylase
MPTGKDRKRVETVLHRLQKLAGFSGSLKVVSENSLRIGKGLGFSASGFAALGLAASEALGLNLDAISLSEIVRLGAGSSTRSLAGGFAIWYADKNGKSYSEPLKAPKDIDFSMVIVPIHSDVITDEAHSEALSSPLFTARCRNIHNLLDKMKAAIRKGDTATVGLLAEEDTLNLHATTMTGKSHMILWEPDTVRIMREADRMRNGGLPVWYSMDTGPSVFINTDKRSSKIVEESLQKIGTENVIISGVGGKPILARRHLF